MLYFTGSYILKNLTSSTRYSIYVRAVRFIGESNEILEGSKSVTATTKTLSTTNVQGNIIKFITSTYTDLLLLYVCITKYY